MSRARRAAVALVALAAALLLGGCGAIEVMAEVEDALEAAGFRDPSVSLDSTDGYEVVSVAWDPGAETPEGLDAEATRAAGVVWRVARVDVDAVVLDLYDPVPCGAPFCRFERPELEEMFGPRPPGLDRDAGEVFGLRTLFTWLAVVAVLGLGAVALVVVALVRAGRRKRAAAAAWYASSSGGWAPPGPWPQGPPPAPPPAGSPDAADPWSAPPR